MRSSPRATIAARARAGLLAAGLLAACAPARRPPATAAAAAPPWVATWAAAQQLTEPRNLPPAPGLAGSTLRQVVHLSVGGRRARVHLSNAFGTAPLVVAAAHVARAAAGGAVDPATDQALTFDGGGAVTIPPGGTATSDAFDYALPALADLAVSLRFPDAPAGAAPRADVTGHPGSRATSYLLAGDQTAAASLPAAARVEHWYVLAGVDVVPDAPAAAVVVLGNSITDGRGSGTDRNTRWPDVLAGRLQADARTRQVAVLNAGIGGNCVLRACLGPAAVDRVDRDVLAPAGVRWLLVLEGVNDIGGAQGAEASSSVARDLIAAHARIAAQAHARGLRVYGATILPFGGSFYASPAHEAARQVVNQWIRTGGAYDAVVDFDAVMRDPADPTRLRADGDGGDHLHPNEAGYRRMGEAVDLGLFARR